MTDARPTTIGYFIPEFPGQTHIFFWRERKKLLELGVRAELVSTNRPPQHLVSHAWSQSAARETIYLFPPSPAQLAGAAVELLRAGPAAWLRCLRAIITAEANGATARLRLPALMLMGAVLARCARKRSWRHIHVHSCANAATVAMFCRLIAGVSYSLTLHGGLHDYGPDQKNKWRYASFGIVITRTLMDDLRRTLAGCLPPRIELAPMGVDFDTFTRTTPYQPWNGSGPFLLFSCGRLNPCKGHDDALRALALVRSRGIDAHLAIAGQDDTQDMRYRRTLDALVQELSLEGCVRLLGAVDEQVVHTEMERAHVFVLASLHEPLGVAIMEAMAMAVPVVVTREGGVPELVEDGTDGVLVDARAPDRIASALESLARDPERARSLGAHGLRTVAERFHSGVSARVIAECVASLKEKT